MHRLHTPNAQGPKPYPIRPMNTAMAGPGLTPAAHFLAAQADGYLPSWAEIVAIVASLKASAKAATLCPEVDCCSFGQARPSSCACAMDEDARIAADLYSASDKAGKAHRAQEQRAMRLQLQHQNPNYL